MPSITAVTLDLWDTLIKDPEGIERQRIRRRIEGTQAILHEHGHPIPLEEIERGYTEGRRLCRAFRTLYCDISSGNQVRLFLASIHKGLLNSLPEDAMDKITDIYAKAVLSLPPLILPHAQETVKALSQEGYRLGLICNTGSTPGSALRLILQDGGMLPYFHVLAFSDEVGLCKPDKAIFRHALAALEVSPIEAVHVGDLLDIDIQGAKAAGMRAIWLSPLSDAAGENTVQPDRKIPQLTELVLTLRELASAF